MKRLSWIVLLVALNGCATHHVPKPAVPDPVPTDWSKVLAVPRGTVVSVALDTDDVRRGFMWHVTDATLVISEISAERTLVRRVIARGDVARVTARQQVARKSRRRDWFIGIPIASAFVGGLTGMILGAVQNDRDLKRASAWVFVGSLMASELACVMSYPKTKFEDRVVYVRP